MRIICNLVYTLANWCDTEAEQGSVKKRETNKKWEERKKSDKKRHYIKR